MRPRTPAGPCGRRPRPGGWRVILARCPCPPTSGRLRGKVFRGSAAVRAGLLTRRQLDGPTWQRLFPDVYAHRDRPVTHEVRACAAARLVVPGAVVTGCSAAVFWDVDLVDAEDVVELTVPRGSHPRRVPGLRVRRADLDRADVRLRRGAAVTAPVPTVVRVAASLPGDEAVVAVDRLLRAGVGSLDAVRAACGRAHRTGRGGRRRVCGLADGLAESPQETRVRLLVVRGGLPAPVAQFVSHRGTFVARVDLGWPAAQVAVEYDGLWHADAAQFARDRARLNRLQEAGWRVVFVTAGDLHRPQALVDRIARALDR